MKHAPEEAEKCWLYFALLSTYTMIRIDIKSQVTPPPVISKAGVAAAGLCRLSSLPAPFLSGGVAHACRMV